MPAIGFHASHEQVPPGELLRAIHDAQAAGFSPLERRRPPALTAWASSSMWRSPSSAESAE
jgi:hypothetical protein